MRLLEIDPFFNLWKNINKFAQLFFVGFWAYSPLVRYLQKTVKLKIYKFSTLMDKIVLNVKNSNFCNLKKKYRISTNFDRFLFIVYNFIFGITTLSTFVFRTYMCPHSQSIYFFNYYINMQFIYGRGSVCYVTFLFSQNNK